MAVISMSPELFFEQNGRELTTRPMKGTTKRGLNNDDDLKEAAWLEQDPKKSLRKHDDSGSLAK